MPIELLKPLMDENNLGLVDETGFVHARLSDAAALLKSIAPRLVSIDAVGAVVVRLVDLIGLYAACNRTAPPGRPAGRATAGRF